MCVVIADKYCLVALLVVVGGNVPDIVWHHTTILLLLLLLLLWLLPIVVACGHCHVNFVISDMSSGGVRNAVGTVCLRMPGNWHCAWRCASATLGCVCLMSMYSRMVAVWWDVRNVRFSERAHITMHALAPRAGNSTKVAIRERHPREGEVGSRHGRRRPLSTVVC